MPSSPIEPKKPLPDLDLNPDQREPSPVSPAGTVVYATRTDCHYMDIAACHQVTTDYNDITL